MPGKDPDDRLHMAAAVAGGARAIITWNRKDFPARPLAEHGIRVLDPDSYLIHLADELPDEVLATVVRVASEKRRPPLSTEDLLNALSKAGVPRFVVVLRTRLRELES